MCLAAYKANAENLKLFTEMPQTAVEAQDVGFPASEFCAAWDEFIDAQREVQRGKFTYKVHRKIA